MSDSMESLQKLIQKRNELIKDIDQLSALLPTDVELEDSKKANDVIQNFTSERECIEEELDRLSNEAIKDISPAERKALQEAYDRLKDRIYTCFAIVDKYIPDLLTMNQNHSLELWYSKCRELRGIMVEILEIGHNISAEC